MLTVVGKSSVLTRSSVSRVGLVASGLLQTPTIEQQRFFAKYRPNFPKAEEEQVEEARSRFLKRFGEEEGEKRSARRDYDRSDRPDRRRGEEDWGRGGRGSSGGQENWGRGERGGREFQKDMTSLWDQLDSMKPSFDPNFKPVKFNFPPSNASSTDAVKFLQQHGIKFHHPIPEGFAPIEKFEDAPFHSGVQSLFKKMGFTTPTPVQSVGWSLVFQNKDVIGVAETGSGKTLSFMLPLAEHAKLQPSHGRSAIPKPKGLILVPTRELAQQILNDSRAFLDAYRLAGTVVYGGSSKYTQAQNLRYKNDFVVGTPGRLMDLVQSNDISLERVSYAVFDEADRMLDMGFEPQIRRIMERVPSSRHTLMWSATWPREVQSLAHDFVQDAVRFTVGTDELTANKKIEQRFIFVTRGDAVSKLITLISQINPGSDSKMLIFCETKRSCDQLQWTLEGEKIPVEVIHGDKAQASRDRALDLFKRGRIPILIATDVAARGLDVKDIKTVVNFELPKDEETYVHRIGRTARGGNTGTSISFFKPEDASLAKGLISVLREAGQEIPPQLYDQLKDNRQPPPGRKPRGSGHFNSDYHSRSRSGTRTNSGRYRR